MNSTCEAETRSARGLAPYPVYKDSGVESLGKVPEHWDVRQLGQFGTLSKGNGGNKGDEVPSGIPCVRYGDLYTTHTNFILKSRSFVSKEKATRYTPLRFGDVLFAASGETIEEIGKSAVNLIQTDACCGGDIILFRPKHRVNAQFLGYATDCRPVAIQKSSMGRGITVKHIYGDQLKYVTLGLPPCSEQRAIVRFLDRVDRRIRHYIRAKERLIELLEEQKQAIIRQAVTGQIDVRTGRPYPAYKDSGFEWLGQVPTHWEVCTLGRITESFRTGPFGSMLHQSEYVDGGTPVINPIHMKNGAIIEDPSCSVPKAVAERLSSYRVCLNDLVFSRRGELGRCAIPDYSWDMLIRASNPMFSCGRCPVSLEPLSIRLNRLKNRTIESAINRIPARGTVTRRQIDSPVRNSHRFAPFHGPDSSSVHYPGAQDTRASLCHNRFQSVAP